MSYDRCGASLRQQRSHLLQSVPCRMQSILFHVELYRLCMRAIQPAASDLQRRRWQWSTSIDRKPRFCRSYRCAGGERRPMYDPMPNNLSIPDFVIFHDIHCRIHTNAFTHDSTAVSANICEAIQLPANILISFLFFFAQICLGRRTIVCLGNAIRHFPFVWLHSGTDSVWKSHWFNVPSVEINVWWKRRTLSNLRYWNF